MKITIQFNYNDLSERKFKLEIEEEAIEWNEEKILEEIGNILLPYKMNLHWL